MDYKNTYIECTNSAQAASAAVREEQIEQHVGDNIDYDLITLDGKSSFHAMALAKSSHHKMPINS